MFIFTPKLGEMILFDEHIFQMGWNHQLVVAELKRSMVLLNVGLPSGLFARDLGARECPQNYVQIPKTELKMMVFSRKEELP